MGEYLQNNACMAYISQATSSNLLLVIDGQTVFERESNSILSGLQHIFSLSFIQEYLKSLDF